MRLLTQNQATELDQLSTSDYNISDDSLMDMAGRKLLNLYTQNLMTRVRRPLQLYVEKETMVVMDLQQLYILIILIIT